MEELEYFCYIKTKYLKITSAQFLLLQLLVEQCMV